MPPPRLKGAALRAAREASANPVTGRMLRAMALKDYGIDALLALPPEARPAFDVEPRPLQAAAPRDWGDEALGPPAPGEHIRTTRQLTRAYAAGTASPTHVIERLLDRVTRGDFGNSVHSPFVAVDPAGARAAAEASAKRYREGKPAGPLDGVPVPIKDQHDLKGFVTRGGTKYRATPAESDAFMVRTLRDAGAIVYGKTHLTEWGMTPTGHNPHYAMPRNVYRSDRAAGGSSTGSAVATALGLCTVASGSDGGGSIRTPSALNGVFGLKPTFLRVSRTGDLFKGTVGHTGPIGQSTADLVDFLSTVCVHADPEDPIAKYAPDVAYAAEGWQRALGRGVRGCKIGVPGREWRDAPHAIARAGMDALRALEREGGARLIDLEVRYAEHAPAIGVLTIGPECSGSLTDDVARYAGDMSDDFRVSLNLLAMMSANEFVVGQRARAALRRSVAEALRMVDVLALPTTASLAPAYPLEEDGVAVSDAGAMLGLLRYAFLGNLTGLPACSVPVGRDGELPIGLQIVGDAWDEASVLAVMAHLERLGATALPVPMGKFDLLG